MGTFLTSLQHVLGKRFIAPRKNYIPCCDAECERLQCSHLSFRNKLTIASDSTALVERIDWKRRDCLGNAVHFIDVSHWSRKASGAFNNFTGRSRGSPQYCAISENSIALQLAVKRKERASGRTCDQFVAKGTSKLRKIDTPAYKNISKIFTLKELAFAINHLHPAKVAGPDCISSKLILDAGNAVKS